MGTAPTITIHVRHSVNCKYFGDEFAKRCPCRKHLRWHLNGKLHRRKANTRSWAEAEELKRQLEDQFKGKVPEASPAETRDIRSCVRTFITNKKVEGVSDGVISKHTRELDRLIEYCERQSVFVVQGLTRELLTAFCAGWEKQYPSSQTRAAVRSRLRSFLRFCYDSQWLTRIPALPKITVDEAPTLPLRDEEYARLLKATKKLRTVEQQTQAHALFQLMRWSGMSVRDSLLLSKEELREDNGVFRVVTNRQKTGTHVSVVIPPKVAHEVRSLHNDGMYLFWDGQEDIVKRWTKYVIAPCFQAAKIDRGGNMMSHRLRDTFAVHLLQKGVPIEEVSKALGHESIKTTEKHYAKWVKTRQDRLDDLIMATW